MASKILTIERGVIVPQLLAPDQNLLLLKAGVQPGDIILKIDNVELGDSADALENLRRQIQKIS